MQLPPPAAERPFLHALSPARVLVAGALFVAAAAVAGSVTSVASAFGSTAATASVGATRLPAAKGDKGGTGAKAATTSTTTTTTSTTTTSTTTTTTSTTTTIAPITTTVAPTTTSTTTSTTTTVAPTTTVVPPSPVRSVEIVGTRDVAFGFAEQRGVTGGLAGTSYVITSTADNGPGTYRNALAGGDRYITFGPELRGATIRLSSPVSVSASNLTIDGSGSDVTVTGYATKFSGTNVVVAGMTYRSMTGSTNEDAITFRDPSGTQVFALYGNTFSTATDGLVDVIWNRGHDVYGTVCGNRFERHDKAMLVHSGNADLEGGTYHITLCRNSWDDVYQRAPLSRDALVHQYNDVFERYGKPDGAGGGSKSGASAMPSEHLLERNIAVPRALGERTWDGSLVTAPRREYAGPTTSGEARVRIDGSLLLSTGGVTASQKEQQPASVFTPQYAYPLLPASQVLRRAVVAGAGTCPASSGGRSVNPCGALLVSPAGASLAVQADGVPSAVELFLDGQSLGLAAAAGGGRWSLALDPSLTPPGTVGALSAVAFNVDGTSVSTSPTPFAVT